MISLFCFYLFSFSFTALHFLARPLALRWMPIGIGLPCCDLLFFLQTALCDAFRLHTDMLEGSGHRMSCLERGSSKHESGPDPAPPPRCPVHAHDRDCTCIRHLSLARAAPSAIRREASPSPLSAPRVVRGTGAAPAASGEHSPQTRAVSTLHVPPQSTPDSSQSPGACLCAVDLPSICHAAGGYE